MATIHAGTKRSFHEMHTADHGSLGYVSRRSSRDASRSMPPSRESSVPRVLADAHLLTSTREPLPRKVTFGPDASIMLIGIRGTGKSSLGFLAATAYSRRLVESDRMFLEATGSTTTVFRKTHGAVEYHRRHADVLRALLNSNDQNAVIVCNFSDLEAQGATLIQEFAQTHPVIYVNRDAGSIQGHLRSLSAQRVEELIQASESLLRRHSNFEFYNLTAVAQDSVKGAVDAQRSRTTMGRFLTLKRAERDFLKFLRNIIGHAHRNRSHQSAYPLSQLGVEERDFTCAVVVSVKDVLSAQVALEEAQVGVDAIQLTVDLGDDARPGERQAFHAASEAFALIRRSTILPIWISVSTAEPRHCSRTDMVEFCLRLAPEFCSADLSLESNDLVNILANKGRSRIVGSYDAVDGFEHGWRDHQCLEVYEKARRLGCDIVEMRLPGRSTDDNFEALAYQQKVAHLHNGHGPRVVAYCSGPLGRTSMCLNKTLTPVVPAAAIEERSESGVTAQQRMKALFAGFVFEPLRFFIYGGDVDFSLSPAMHNAAYQACGMSHVYRTHSAPDMHDFHGLVSEQDFGGAAVVQPHKTAVIPLMDVLSPHAKAIGALNSVIPLRHDLPSGSPSSYAAILRDQNRTGPVKALFGDNTDWIGIRACIRRGLSPANTVRPQSSGLVAGAGGMARAAIYAMISLGVRNIFICSRTYEKAEALAAHYNQLIRANDIVELSPEDAPSTSVTALESFDRPWPPNARHPTMIVSCIPTWQADGAPTNFTLPVEWLSSRTGGVAIELSYKPAVTPLVLQMRQEQDKGWIVMDGLDMLPEQAFAQFELFTGRRAPRKLMREQILHQIREAELQSRGT